jgi:acetolactate synthase-1/2/3 large subunit
VPYDHPLFVGRPGIVATRGSNWAIQSCDLLLAIGTRLDQSIVAYDYQGFAPDAKKIMVDIDEGEGLKMPNLDLFINKDAGEFIRELNKSKYGITPVEWLLQCAEWKQSRMEGDTATYQLMDELSETLPNDAILVLDSGCMAVNIFCAGFRNKAGQRFILSSCGLGTMGAALPVAIGAAIASGKPVTVISGDGSFVQNIQELEVAHGLNLPITIYIMDNGGYASIRNSEMRTFGRTSGSETIPDIKKIAEAFGVSVHVVDVPRDEVLAPRVLFDGRGSLSEMWPYIDVCRVAANGKHVWKSIYYNEICVHCGISHNART